MKTKSLLSLTLLLVGGALLFNGCKDDEDTTPPVVTLNGDSAPVLFLQQNFVDPGATAEDDEDGSLPVTVSGSVDKNLADVYPITYEATDAAGNTGSAVRVVTYQNELSSSPFEGSYDCVITGGGLPPYNYTESLSVSNTLNQAVMWSKFGDYSNANARLNMFLNGGNQIAVPTQTIICGNPAVARTFSGSGTYTGSGGTGSAIILNITETVNGTPGNFTYSYTKN